MPPVVLKIIRIFQLPASLYISHQFWVNKKDQCEPAISMVSTLHEKGSLTPAAFFGEMRNFG
jgi:hypothetical protein